MKKILIGLLAVFAACNTAEFPKNLGKSRAKKHLIDFFKKEECNGYTKKECKEGRAKFGLTCCLEETYVNDSFYRLLINDGNKKPCITQYAYSVGNWDGKSVDKPKFSKDNVTIYVQHNVDFIELCNKFNFYYSKAYSKCIFFVKRVEIPSMFAFSPCCMILKREYVTPLTKVEAEEYLKNHPETVNLEKITYYNRS